ncbi:hypothetical protein ILUMI_00124 [Ignelater luminosus]|uniref:BAG domain-containing protein n=1 Tax=Ignelater luminosus TaxID=2038154 RepID=A0A8K0GNE8_IGNLU|nr:hypothetical protein ILUMI_00124 [Ignelater luminosus]
MSKNENTKQGMTDMFSRGMKWLKFRTKISKKDGENDQQQHEMKHQSPSKQKKENVNTTLPVNNEVRREKPTEVKKQNAKVPIASHNHQERKEDVNDVPSAPPRANKKPKQKLGEVQEPSSEVVKSEGINVKQENLQNQTLKETQGVLEKTKNVMDRSESREQKEAIGEIKGVPDTSIDNSNKQNIPNISKSKEDASKPKEKQAEQTKTENEFSGVYTNSKNDNSSSTISASTVITKTHAKQIATSTEKKDKEVYEIKSETIETNSSKGQELQKSNKNENHHVNLKSSQSLKCQVNQYQEQHAEATQIRKLQSFSSRNQTRLQYNQATDQTKKEAIGTTSNLSSKKPGPNVDKEKQENYNPNNQVISETKINNAENVEIKSNQNQNGNIQINQTNEYIRKEYETMKFVEDHYGDQTTKPNVATYTFEESHKQEKIISNSTEEEDLIKESTESFKEIEEEIEELEQFVANFTGTTTDSDEYYYLDESLMKCLFKLDNVPSKNNQTIREKRRSGIKHVQAVIKKLDQKIKENQKSTSNQS